MGWSVTHRISRDLTDIAKGDILPAAIDAVSETIRAKFVHSDEDRLGYHRLAPRIGPTWWCGGARGEIQWQEFDPISGLDRCVSPQEKRKSDFRYPFPFLLTGKGRRNGEEKRGRACCYLSSTPSTLGRAWHATPF